MLKNFESHVENHFSFLKESKLLIAVSGGIDSVVLASLAYELKWDFTLCHCNFQLRGNESDGDEVFVKDLAEKLGVPLFTTQFETEGFAKENKLSIQVAARDLRYKWFYELIEEHSCDFVLTAHNANDNLETFLINLSRGSGLEGLTGIPSQNNKTVRPLLKFSRDQIQMYAIKNGIVWREDRSNANIKYIRNKVRHKILPVLKEINPHILETFQKTLEYLNESQDLVDDSVAEISKKVMTIEDEMIRIDLKKLHQLEQLKGYLYRVLHPYGFTEWNDVVNLTSAQSGKQVFSDTHRLLKDRNKLILTKIKKDHLENPRIQISADQRELEKPIHLLFQDASPNSFIDGESITVDKDLLKYPLSIRKWGHGDYICPIGMNGTKKLSQLFKDKKLSLIDKERIWLLTDAEDQIIWVIGMRQDRRFLTSRNSLNILKIIKP